MAAMGLSLRMLVVDQTDSIYRLDLIRFGQMLDNPTTHPFTQFAGQRVRSAEAVVELIERKPVRVVRMTFHILTFDQTGCLDKETFHHQQFSRFAGGASALGGLTTGTEPASRVLDARYLFADRGGRWVPSETLLHAMHGAALGNVRVPRL
jgi:hypothetical protein